MKLKRWLGVTLLLGLLLPPSAQAQTESPLRATLEEQEALLCINQQKLVRLRELASTMLDKNPEACSSNFFMGYSLHHAEGDLPHARYYLNLAVEKYHKRFGEHADRSQPYGWLEKSLLELEQVTAEMDQYQDQIEVLNQFSQLTQDLTGMTDSVTLQPLYAWPLMKLNNEQEARQRLARAAHYSDESTRTNYLNTLGAVETETDHPNASFRCFTTLLHEVEDRGWNMTATFLRNGGEAAAGVAQPQMAEQLYLMATNHFDPTSYSNPWWDLSNLYLGEGRTAEAVTSLSKAQEWVHRSEPFLEQQSWAMMQQLACEIFMQCGLNEAALKHAQEIVDRPDRKGADSVRPDQWEAANLLVYREALQCQRHADAEQMSWSTGRAWWKLLFERMSLGYQAYLAGQRAAAIIVEHDRLLSSLRYYYAPRTIPVPSYIRPDLVDIYGAGTTLAAVDKLLETPFEGLSRETPYLQALQAEAYASSGQTSEADQLINHLMETLPNTEVLLRARLTARLAQLRESEGDEAGALKCYQTVLEQSPSMLRLLDLQIPVEVAGAQGSVLEKAASLTLGSPRFRRRSGGFTIQFQEGGKGYQALLMTPNGTVMARAQVEPGKAVDDTARKLVAELHAAFFAANVDMSQIDVNSLDGAITGKVRSNQLQSMFGLGSGEGDAGSPTPSPVP